MVNIFSLERNSQEFRVFRHERFNKYTGHDLDKQYEDILPQIRAALKKDKNSKKDEQELESDFY